MINWRSIADVGYPMDDTKRYLVTDGKDISVSGTYCSFTSFGGWSGDDNTGEDNDCCSGIRYFDMTPTHWCPIDELNLPDAAK